MFKSKSIRFLVGVVILLSIRHFSLNSTSTVGVELVDVLAKNNLSQRSISSQRRVAGEIKTDEESVVSKNKIGSTLKMQQSAQRISAENEDQFLISQGSQSSWKPTSRNGKSVAYFGGLVPLKSKNREAEIDSFAQQFYQNVNSSESLVQRADQQIRESQDEIIRDYNQKINGVDVESGYLRFFVSTEKNGITYIMNESQYFKNIQSDNVYTEEDLIQFIKNKYETYDPDKIVCQDLKYVVVEKEQLAVLTRPCQVFLKFNTHVQHVLYLSLKDLSLVKSTQKTIMN